MIRYGLINGYGMRDLNMIEFECETFTTRDALKHALDLIEHVRKHYNGKTCANGIVEFNKVCLEFASGINTYCENSENYVLNTLQLDPSTAAKGESGLICFDDVDQTNIHNNLHTYFVIDWHFNKYGIPIIEDSYINGEEIVVENDEIDDPEIRKRDDFGIRTYPGFSCLPLPIVKDIYEDTTVNIWEHPNSGLLTKLYVNSTFH